MTVAVGLRVMLLLKSFQPSLSLLHIMLIFDTESHIWAFLGLFFIFSLFLFSLFIELTRAKRALDSSHCPASHCQARLLCTALQDTLIFLGLYPHSFLPSICFLGEWAARQGLVCGQDKLLFCSPDKGWKTTLPHHSCTQTRTHLHRRHSSAPIHTSGHRSAWCVRWAVEHVQKGHPSLWTCGFGWVCLQCLRAAPAVCACPSTVYH